MKIEEVKKYIARNIKIDYQGGRYTVTACILRIWNGQWYYQLELKEVGVNSVLIVAMDKVESKLEDFLF